MAQVFGEQAVSPPSRSTVKKSKEEDVMGRRSGREDEATKNASEIVKLITLAPEVQGVGESVRELVKRDWVVSIGHS